MLMILLYFMHTSLFSKNERRLTIVGYMLNSMFLGIQKQKPLPWPENMLHIFYK